MNIDEYFNSRESTMPTTLSEMVEMQCAIQDMLSAIITELAMQDPIKEQKMIDDANKYREEEVLRVIARFASEGIE